MSGSINRRILVWLTGRETGECGSCMANWLGYGLLTNQGAAPLSPSDFGRCLSLLELVPEFRERLNEMSKVSPGWAALVAHWDEVEKMFIDEVGMGWHKGFVAPKTFQLMRQIYNGLTNAQMRPRPKGVDHVHS